MPIGRDTLIASKDYSSDKACCLSVKGDFRERLAIVCRWHQSPLPPGLQARIEREYALLEFVEQQIWQAEAERREALRSSTAPSVEQVRRLLCLRGIGENSAWLYVMEFFGWRQFYNRQEIGGRAA